MLWVVVVMTVAGFAFAIGFGCGMLRAEVLETRWRAEQARQRRLMRKLVRDLPSPN